MDETLSQVCSTDKDESKRIITDESSTEEIKPECAHKSVNNKKDAKNDIEHEEPTVRDDPIVVKEPIHSNIF